jgi:vacuolar protein sorting-associated protein 13A/C
MTWDRLKQVSVEREGQRVFSLRPKLNNVTHRLLCDIKLVDNVKVITFRSTFQVENRTLVVAEMVVVDANGKRASPIYKIRKLSSIRSLRGCLFSFDLEFVYSSR